MVLYPRIGPKMQRWPELYYSDDLRIQTYMEQVSLKSGKLAIRGYTDIFTV